MTERDLEESRKWGLQELEGPCTLEALEELHSSALDLARDPRTMELEELVELERMVARRSLGMDLQLVLAEELVHRQG